MSTTLPPHIRAIPPHLRIRGLSIRAPEKLLPPYGGEVVDTDPCLKTSLGGCNIAPKGSNHRTEPPIITTSSNNQPENKVVKIPSKPTSPKRTATAKEPIGSTPTSPKPTVAAKASIPVQSPPFVFEPFIEALRSSLAANPRDQNFKKEKLYPKHVASSPEITTPNEFDGNRNLVGTDNFLEPKFYSPQKVPEVDGLERVDVATSGGTTENHGGQTKNTDRSENDATNGCPVKKELDDDVTKRVDENGPTINDRPHGSEVQPGYVRPMGVVDNPLEFLEKHFKNIPNPSMSVPVDQLVSLISAFKSMRTEVYQAVSRADELWHKLATINRAHQIFARLFKRSGLDVQDMWAHSMEKALNHLDENIKSGDFMSPNLGSLPLDEEKWLYDLLVRAGIIREVAKPASSDDPSGVVAHNTDLGILKIAGTAAHLENCALILAHAGEDFLAVKSRTMEDYVEKPYTLQFKAIDPIEEHTDKIGIVQPRYQRPLSPPVFHLGSIQENGLWPGQVEAAKAAKEEEKRYGKLGSRSVKRHPESGHQNFLNRQIPKRGGMVPNGLYHSCQQADDECTWEVEQQAALAYYTSEGNSKMVHILKERAVKEAARLAALRDLDDGAEKNKRSRWHMGNARVDYIPPPEEHPWNEAPKFVQGSEKTLNVVKAHQKTSPVVKSQEEALNLTEAQEKTSTTPVGINGDSPSGSLPTGGTPPDSDVELRMVILNGLPHDITHSDLCEIIRGGPILGVRLIVGHPFSRSEVVFIHGVHATAYYDFMSAGPFRFGGKTISVALDKGPRISEAEKHAFSRKDVTRVLCISLSQKHHTPANIRSIAEEVIRRGKRAYSMIDVTQKSDIPINFEVKFTHLKDAIAAKEVFLHKGYKVSVGPDKCRASISGLPQSRSYKC
ncbi:hypothetical protein FN846DRAFT_923663 [Sphaerosporella brunnea]|uniref:Uncharacterized protein n=1 Tax=Sphaerosporella brunnea TaxID=1250544 RepID=A0A5J5EDV5_9PEZI|nr:hypothetical protein FN846DRAFT_923663 [Sphaerosporella brunnea]